MLTLMRDEETGTYWQQISGAAISGPLKGLRLTRVASDELNFSTWKSEQPHGTVLKDVRGYESGYAAKDWDVRMQRVPTVISFAEHGLSARSLMLGIESGPASRAWLYEQVIAAKLVKDYFAGDPVLLVVGPDGESVRAFGARIPGVPGSPDFYRLPDGTCMDHATGSSWSFQGCAVNGPAKPACLERLTVLKDYWFDWRNYHPNTTVWGGPPGPPLPETRY